MLREYIDGHVRACHGQHTIAKAHVTRMHLAAPATTDYWVNDQRGDPLFVVTADANAALTKMLVPILTEVRQLLGPRRHSTIVFDRGGWSPKLFRSLLDMGFDILTYRKPEYLPLPIATTPGTGSENSTIKFTRGNLSCPCFADTLNSSVRCLISHTKTGMGSPACVNIFA